MAGPAWCIGGCPLLDGSGWQLWYSRPGREPFRPRKVRLSRPNGEAVATRPQRNRSIDPLDGFDRRIAIAEVRLKQPEPGAWFELRIPELGDARMPRWQALPDRIGPRGMAFLFASCFYHNQDKEGHYRACVEEILDKEDPLPAFRMLLGDQIYLDWPPPAPPWTVAGAGRRVGARYRRYWGDDQVREALLATPNFFLSDDHEFWNNYPHRQVHLPHIWRGTVRAAYDRVTNAYFEAFQSGLNPDRRRWFRFDIPPASFFVADARTARTPVGSAGRLFDAEQWDALEAWQQGLAGPGFLMLAQPLMDEAGSWQHHTLASYPREYARLLRLVERSFSGDNADGRPHDIVLFGGDIHSGRHAERVSPAIPPGSSIHELVASPVARVTDIKLNPQAKQAPSSIRPDLPGGAPHWQPPSGGGDRFASLDNNLGLVRLVASEKTDYALRMQFVSYRVRAYRPPAWNLPARWRSRGADQARHRAIYRSQDIYLR